MHQGRAPSGHHQDVHQGRAPSGWGTLQAIQMPGMHDSLCCWTYRIVWHVMTHLAARHDAGQSLREESVEGLHELGLSVTAPFHGTHIDGELSL